ncbi:heme ABC transporter ATP-binding protein CcmA [Vibrio sp. HA2012]|uniref:cytochrome c biogenesis heme-transporting ATPase CcmA n=1 Tax=Vibrio sp. HA2012 TaxID=1971595 RepID=UPI000C2BD3F0|nr:cytochrome c biogenesis heme-transporting ATPase CcmA [Vibrio sp. HA2012]PJC88243.1 heme ABC transporter ATP-binding protein CcmA [Vibrio sp. HA2012]
MLEISALSAIRGERVLFKELSFSMNPGELIQIEGRNGSGKTTLLRIIAGLGDSEGGDVFWKGHLVHTIREQYHQDLLFLGHLPGVKRELTGYENLMFHQSLVQGKADSEQIWTALARVGLGGREDIPVAQLSAGQQRRVALARLWLSRQPLWILDEPLTAIDKQGVRVLEKLFLEHTKLGGMVLLTTHQDMFINRSELRRIRLGD